MSENSAKILYQLMSAKSMHDINYWVTKYPADQKQSAVMSTLRIVQEEHSYLTTELMDAVADYLDMAPIGVYEVASFYTMYEHQPLGKHLVNVCTSISCLLRDSAGVVSHLENKLGIELGGTTDDGRLL